MQQCYILFLIFLTSPRWLTVGATSSQELKPSRIVKRNSFHTDDISSADSVHIPNELELNQRHPLQPNTKADVEFIQSDYKTAIPDGVSAPPFGSELHSTNRTEYDEHSAIHVASWQWEYVRTPFIYTSVVIVAGLCKIGFHHAEFLSTILPESCILIVLGIIVGTIVHFTQSREFLPQFTPKAFFLFLLPPIVLESAYSLHDRAFFSNLGTIVLYAVVGTIINCFVIGLSLYGLTSYGAVSDIKLQMVECLVFSALISAVDPVAVLAIFQEVGVNKNLYFLVFGESLLNDAVTIVLYMMMVGFSKAEYITAEQIAVGIAAFVCVSLGGLAIGIAMGILTALITKHTEDVRVVEPLAMLGVAYLSYLLAEMVHFSGIISIIGCGIVQAHYASKNISDKSNTTVKYFTKMVSAVCDTVIFLFLGMVLVDDQHIWHTGFVFWSTGLCFFVRFASVFLLTYIANKTERTHRINTEEQFIMAYGGLRGAVAFSLVIMLDDIEHKNLFTSATLFIVLFTVFVQGATIKPLVNLLKIRRQGAKNSTSMFTEVNKKLLDHVMAGVEEVTGDHGGNYWKQLLFYYNNKYLKKWLQCKKAESNLSRVYTRMMLEDHFAHLYGPAVAIEDHKPLLLNKVSMEDTEDILEVLPPVTEENEEEIEIETKEEDGEKVMDGHKLRRQSCKFDLQDSEEGKPLRSKKKRNSDSAATPERPPLFKTQTTLALFTKSPEDDASKLLQKAFSDNPYNKLHQKYNPNLVSDESRDMAALLKIRRLRARRLTLLAMHKKDSETPIARRPSVTEEQIQMNNPMVPLAASFFLEKAQRRRMLKRESVSSQEGEGASSSPPTNSKSTKLERQCAITTQRGSSATFSIAEEESEVNVIRRSSKDSAVKVDVRNSNESMV
nr:Na(+)/H(+) exchanger beta [Parasteatoda tepidariorum]